MKQKGKNISKSVEKNPCVVYAISDVQKGKYLYPVYVKGVPVNRKQKRITKDQVRRVMRDLDEIETKFLDWLFGYDGEGRFYDYRQTYEHFHHNYHKMMTWWMDHGKVRNLEFNFDYFPSLYRPIEGL